MVDQLIEIPLPGRTAVPLANGGDLVCETGVRLPAFIAGPENRLVAATMGWLLHQADSEPVHLTYRSAPSMPFVLSMFGPSGVGKTHLSQGLVRHWQMRRGVDSAEFVTAQDFRRLLNDSMSTRSVATFRDRIRNRELLAIDELHRLPSDDYLLQELRSTLDALEERGAMVVVTSTRPVTALPNLSPDLRSRLASGLMLQLASPGMAARMRIVQQFSAALGRPLTDEMVHRLAAGLRGTANRLIGAIFELCAELQNNAEPAADPVSKLLASRDAERPTPREIAAVVARFYGVSQRLLKSNSRKQRLVRARATAIYLARELCQASFEQIGQALGGRDHTTIMHNFRKVERERQYDFAMNETLADLRRILVSR